MTGVASVLVAIAVIVAACTDDSSRATATKAGTRFSSIKDYPSAPQDWKTRYPPSRSSTQSILVRGGSLPASLIPDCSNEDLVERTEIHSYPLGEAERLVVRVDVGEFLVVADDRDDVQLQLTRRIGSANEQVIEAIRKQHVVSHQLDKHQLIIQAAFQGQGPRSELLQHAAFRLLVPRHQDVELTTECGAIQVRDLSGQVIARTKAGSIALENLSGIVEADSPGGTIHLKDCLDVKADSNGGVVSALYSSQPQRDCRLQAAANSLQVGLASDINVRVRSNQTIGRVPGLGKFGGRSFSIGSNGPKIQVQNKRGTVRYFVLESIMQGTQGWLDDVPGAGSHPASQILKMEFTREFTKDCTENCLGEWEPTCLTNAPPGRNTH